MRKFIVISCLLFVFAANLCHAEGSVLEAFHVTTRNVVIKQATRTSLELRADTNTYLIKLSPNRQGRVAFALSGIGYTSTARVPNLRFGVRILGYAGEDILSPAISLDDTNNDIGFFGDTIVFNSITNALPIWFDEQVDSIHLEFFNSMNLNIDQYLAISDLRILAPHGISPNPSLRKGDNRTVMIGIDGSSSITKHEREMISNQLLDMIRSAELMQDTTTVCLLEFGTRVHAFVETTDEKELKKAVRLYKRDKNTRANSRRFTNWSVAFDEAIARHPDVFIFITDGWSNWSNGQPTSFTAQFDELVARTNTLKEQGTRLLFITSGLESSNGSNANLYHFLNGRMTREMDADKSEHIGDLSAIDLVTMNQFAHFDRIDLSSILAVPAGMASADAMMDDPSGE